MSLEKVVVGGSDRQPGVGGLGMGLLGWMA